MINRILFLVVSLIVLSWFVSLPLVGVVDARTITTSTINSTTIRYHITATSWADMIDPRSDCETAPPDGSWGFNWYKTPSGPDALFPTASIYPKSNLDVTEDFDFTAVGNGTYVAGITWGSTATNWLNLYNVTSCDQVGEKPFNYTGNTNGYFGTTTVPIALPPAVTNIIQMVGAWFFEE